MYCELHRIQGDEIEFGRFNCEECLELIDESDAVCFGSPTYMGGPAAQFKAFADASSERWESQQWSDKLASGFTTGINPGGDQLSTLQYFAVLASQHGMVWLGLDNPKGAGFEKLNSQGTQLGFSSHIVSDKISDSDASTALYFGERIAGMAMRLSRGVSDQ